MSRLPHSGAAAQAADAPDLPRDTDLERDLLGGIVRAGDVATLASARLLVDETSYHSDRHRVIWRALCALVDTGHPPDLMRLVAHLRDAGLLDLAGGAPYVSALSDGALSSTVPEKAEALAAIAARRRLAEAAARAIPRLAGGEDVDEVYGSIASAYAGASRWPAEPRPLDLADDPPDLDPELLPDRLRPWLADLAHRHEVPLDCVAGPALVAAGAAIGRRRRILPAFPNDWTVYPTLWGGVVLPSGERKTACIAEALRPLEALESEAWRQHQAGLADAQAEHTMLLMALERLKRAMGKAAPDEIPTLKAEYADTIKATEVAEKRLHPPRYVVEDATSPKLASLLECNPLGLLLRRDELAGWLRQLDDDSGHFERAFFLSGWNGDGSYTVDRQSRPSTRVEGMFLSVVGGIQPGVFARYVSEAAGGERADGLLQRFQVVSYRPRLSRARGICRNTPDDSARERATRCYRWLAALPAVEQGMTLSPEAFSLFEAANGELERAKVDAMARCAPFAAALSKWPRLVAVLSLVGQLVDDTDPSNLVVGADAVGRAVGLATYYLAHVQALYAEWLGSPRPARALAELIRSGGIEDGVPVRELHRRGRSDLATAGDIVAAMEELQRLGWLRVEHAPARAPDGQGGRPRRIVRLHPALRSAGVPRA